jgi:hypothetical protein
MLDILPANNFVDNQTTGNVARNGMQRRGDSASPAAQRGHTTLTITPPWMTRWHIITAQMRNLQSPAYIVLFRTKDILDGQNANCNQSFAV